MRPSPTLEGCSRHEPPRPHLAQTARLINKFLLAQVYTNSPSQWGRDPGFQLLLAQQQRTRVPEAD